VLALLLRAYRIILPSTKLWVAIKHVLQRAELFGNRVIFNVTKSCTICILAYFSLFVNGFLTKRKKNGKLFFFSSQIATKYAWEKFYNNTKRALWSPQKKGLINLLCEKCKKRTATVFYNENLNGKVRSYSLCGECAAKLHEKGDIGDITSMLGSFADPFCDLHENLFGGFFGMGTQPSMGGKKCPDCSSTFARIRGSGRVGCPTCYRVFAEELAPTLHTVHGATTHTGAVPARHRARRAKAEKLKQLKRQMQEAIAKENFEAAASLRDEIKQLEENKGKECDA
jgi:protein arginine kinase activator